jgi:glycyl-tRNA synthetase
MRTRGAMALRRGMCSAEKAKHAVPELISDGTTVDMHTIVSLCKRRGFVFPSSEIYSGFAGFFDYGPLGTELRNNIKQAWWQDMVHKRDDVVGLDCSIISAPAVWEASGHVGGFSDPMVDCKDSKLR